MLYFKHDLVCSKNGVVVRKSCNRSLIVADDSMMQLASLHCHSQKSKDLSIVLLYNVCDTGSILYVYIRVPPSNDIIS